MTIIYSRTLADGSSVQEMPDGSTRPMPPGRTDWARLDAMTDEEITANALADPDNPPLTAEQRARLRPVAAAKRLRWRLGLTQAAFAERYRIALGTLREWGQHRSEPDQTARAYLAAIAGDPEGVHRALLGAAAAAE